jgi:prepilin-type N-terminal cleavage/methylation domain-containing protein
VTRLRDERGFTLAEMIVAAGILGIVVIGALTMIEVMLRQSNGVVQRTEAAQRGRLVLDQMTRQIRSQVCLDETVKGLVAASPTALTFYADLGTGAAGTRPTRRTLAYEPQSRVLRESVWVANPNGSYPTVATRSTILLDHVEPTLVNPKRPADGALPVFGYFQYPEPLPADPRPDQALTGTLAPAQVGRVAMVRINFTVRPPRSADPSIFTPLRDDIQLRNADPNATTPDPTCK